MRTSHGKVRLVAIIRPFRARAVLEALAALDIEAGLVREVMGFGRQKARLHRYLGSEYDTSFLPKVELTLFLDADRAAEAVRAIVAAARAGRMGDGKIFVQRCDGIEGEEVVAV
jgi:nitrogen regulatory protein PII